MKDQKLWHELLERLGSVCICIAEGLDSALEGDVAARIAHALFKKGFDTYRAIAVLYGESLPIQGQVLVRVLMESRMDLEWFLRLSAEDPRQAARRLVDTMMLEKVRQQRQSGFRGLELVDGAPSPEVLLALEGQLVVRYGKNCARAMRRHGFSGLSVEERANELGLGDLYNVVYRNFSRNVHGTDYMEHIRLQGIGNGSELADYEDLRDHVALSTAITCLLHMAALMSDQFEYGLNERLNEIFKECRAFSQWIPIPGRNSNPGA